MTRPAPDELAIRSLVARYADAVNRYDEALWAGTWTVNSVWDLAGMEVEGRKGVVDFWRNAMGSFEFAIQLVSQGTIEIEGDRASDHWYLTETLRPKGADADRITIGCNVDEYVKENGPWCFAKRTYRVLYDREREQGNFTLLT